MFKSLLPWNLSPTWDSKLALCLECAAFSSMWDHFLCSIGTLVLTLSKIQVPLCWGPCRVSFDFLTPRRVSGRVEDWLIDEILHSAASQVQVAPVSWRDSGTAPGLKDLFLFVNWNVGWIAFVLYVPLYGFWSFPFDYERELLLQPQFPAHGGTSKDLL